MPTNVKGSDKPNPLELLHEAILLIASEVSIEKVLQEIVDTARNLVSAQYAALGISNVEGQFTTFVHSGIPAETLEIMGGMPHGKGLLGAVIAQQKAIRIPKISIDSRAVGLPKDHPPMGSFLGVPLLINGEAVGNLYLTEKAGGKDFSAEDQQLIEMLAAHAAISIVNARLYKQVKRLAVVEERNRLGMDLHDGVIQSIYAVGLTLESARLATEDDVDESVQLIEMAVKQLNRTIGDIRNFIMDLRPRNFGRSLHKGICRLIREFQANTLILAVLEFEIETPQLPTGQARSLFLTIQEALANVARHSEASEVKVMLLESAETITLTICDNGKGFDTDKLRSHTGHGLSNMQTRAETLGGHFKIESTCQQGTTLHLILPKQTTPTDDESSDQ